MKKRNTARHRSVKRIRAILGVTGEEMAHILDISPRALVYVESGERSFPKPVAQVYRVIANQVLLAEKYSKPVKSEDYVSSPKEVKEWTKAFHAANASLVSLRFRLDEMKSEYIEAFFVDGLLKQLSTDGLDAEHVSRLRAWIKVGLARNRRRLLRVGPDAQFRLNLRIRSLETEYQLIQQHLDQIAPGWRK